MHAIQTTALAGAGEEWTDTDTEMQEENGSVKGRNMRGGSKGAGKSEAVAGEKNLEYQMLHTI